MSIGILTVVVTLRNGDHVKKISIRFLFKYESLPIYLLFVSDTNLCPTSTEFPINCIVCNSPQKGENGKFIIYMLHFQEL